MQSSKKKRSQIDGKCTKAVSEIKVSRAELMADCQIQAKMNSNGSILKCFCVMWLVYCKICALNITISFFLAVSTVDLQYIHSIYI